MLAALAANRKTNVISRMPTKAPRRGPNAAPPSWAA